jgi:hypothetical protein
MSDRTLFATIPAAAVGVDTETILGSISADWAPWGVQVLAVRYTPVTVVTGVNTNTRKLEVWNRGPGGAGTGVMASKQFDSGVNAPALSDTPITVLAAGVGTPQLPAALPGDTLTARSIHVGTGIADPGGLVEVDVARYAAPS